MSKTMDGAANLGAVAIAVCAIAITFANFFGSSGRRNVTVLSTPEPDTTVVENWARYLKGGHDLGDSATPITILEFGDYECPSCRRFDVERSRIMTQFPTQVRFVYRHWPLEYHRFAYPAARAAECAGNQKRFWQMHEIIFAKADSLGLLSFQEMAQRAGVADSAAFARCNTSSDTVPAIEASIRDVRALGGTGTPTLLVNGIRRKGVDTEFIGQLLQQLSSK